MEPARVSSPQVDLTRYGLDKTPTVLVLQSRGTPSPPRGRGIHSGRAPLPREEELRSQRLVTISFQSDVTFSHHPQLGETEHTHCICCPSTAKKTQGVEPYAGARPKTPSSPSVSLARPPPPSHGEVRSGLSQKRPWISWAPREGARTGHARGTSDRAGATAYGV